MTWLLEHWQTLAVATIVAGTVIAFVWRALRARKSRSCGSGCSCGVKPGRDDR